MSKTFLLITVTLIGITQTTFVPNRPDAIRCGGDNTCCDGAMFFPHGLSESKGSMYCQVFSYKDRCVIFHSNGSFNYGRGDYDTRKGCEGKSLEQLKEEGRTYNL